MAIYLLGPQVLLGLPGLVSLVVGSFALAHRKRCARRCTVDVPSSPSFVNKSTEVNTGENCKLIVTQNRAASSTDNSNNNNNQSTRLTNNTSSSNNNNECFNSCNSTYGPNSLYTANRISNPYPDVANFSGLRLGLFSFLYFLPELCMNACNLYECLYRDAWLQKAPQEHIFYTGASTIAPDNNQNIWQRDEVVGPKPEVFLLRIFMSLVPGFTCTLWVISVKRKGDLLRAMRSICHRCRPTSESNVKGTGRYKTSVNPLSSAYHWNLVEQPSDFPEAVTGKPHRSKREKAAAANNPPPLYAFYHYYATGGDQNTVGKAPCQWINVKSPITGQLDPIISTGTGVSDTQHSNATTPGYYSQAKLGSAAEASDTFSEESPVPPPLPLTSRPQLPARGDPCIGASATQVSGCLLTDQYNHGKSILNPFDNGIDGISK